MTDEIPDWLYIVRDGEIFFNVVPLIKGMESAVETALDNGLISSEEANGAAIIISPMYEMWLRCCEAEGIDV